jgi:hypothetical protein
MKTLLLTLTALFILTGVNAQKIELSVLAGPGLFHYSGKSTTATSFILQGPNNQNSYTNNPYGNKNGFSYGGGLQAQLISKGGFILGLQAGYDVLRSKVDINGVYPYPSQFELQAPSYYAQNQLFPAKGASYLKNQLINISPYIGYRVNGKKISIDLMPGLDIGFSTSAYDKGSATTTTDPATTYKTNREITNVPTDVRLKFAAALNYSRYALIASYAHGLTNYESRMIGDGAPVPSYEAHSELFKLGIGYRIN